MVQQSDVECQVLRFPGRKTDLQVQGLQDDGIGGSIDESEFDRWNAICRKVLGLNAESMKQSDDPEPMRDLRIVSRSLLEVRESMNESGFERADVLSIRGFA